MGKGSVISDYRESALFLFNDCLVIMYPSEREDHQEFGGIIRWTSSTTKRDITIVDCSFICF